MEEQHSITSELIIDLAGQGWTLHLLFFRIYLPKMIINNAELYAKPLEIPDIFEIPLIERFTTFVRQARSTAAERYKNVHIKLATFKNLREIHLITYSV